VLSENISGEFILLKLLVTDAIGCTEEVIKKVKTYNVTSNIFINPGAFACVGATLILQASDYLLGGSSLTYEWDFGPDFAKSDKKINQIKFEKAGDYKITMKYKEKSSGCGSTATRDVKIFNVPDANFTSDADNSGEICHPKSIVFTNTTVADHGIQSNWKFGNFANSNVFNPTETFPKGKHKVTLVAKSPYGCSDSISREFNLVGPEGDFVIDKDVICSGEKVSFTIKDTVDVNKFTWDFGDGMKLENKSPVVHEYNFIPDGNFIVPRLILKTVENGCELILEDTIKFEKVIAGFERIDSIACDGQVYFRNTSIGGQNFQWEFGDKSSSAEKNPAHLYSDVKDYNVLLVAFSKNGVCKDSFESLIKLSKNNNLVIFPNVFTPNNDNNNDNFNIGYDTSKVGKVEVLTFKVYNRWGHLVYDNNDVINGWNGLYKGQESPAEVYAYYIQLRVNNCNIIEDKGNVTLIR
jgi:gliding motility-associated-like protein